MQSDVKMDYPKPRNKVKGSKLRFGVCEPVRKTLYDIFMENLKSQNRTTYIHRVIYVGKHKSSAKLLTLFRNIINTSNDEYSRERLTGFLLIYSTFFVHVVEGSEDAISKHLSILFETPDYSEYVGEMKLLIQISNVLKRLCPEWMIYHGIPSKLLTPLDEEASVKDTAHTLYKCLRQTYETIKIFVKDNYEASGVRKSPISHESSSSKILPHNDSPLSNDYITPSTSAQEKDRYWQILPEIELIEALVESPYTQTLEGYYELFLYAHQREIYDDMVWPIPFDFIPCDIFSTTYDTVIKLAGHSDTKQNSQNELLENMKKMSCDDV